MSAASITGVPFMTKLFFVDLDFDVVIDVDVAFNSSLPSLISKLINALFL